MYEKRIRFTGRYIFFFFSYVPFFFIIHPACMFFIRNLPKKIVLHKSIEQAEKKGCRKMRARAHPQAQHSRTHTSIGRAIQRCLTFDSLFFVFFWFALLWLLLSRHRKDIWKLDRRVETDKMDFFVPSDFIVWEAVERARARGGKYYSKT